MGAQNVGRSAPGHSTVTAIAANTAATTTNNNNGPADFAANAAAAAAALAAVWPSTNLFSAPLFASSDTLTAPMQLTELEGAVRLDEPLSYFSM